MFRQILIFNAYGASEPSLICLMPIQKSLQLLGGFLLRPGNFLLSHTLARAVQSGLRGLTSVFGMGTGGSLSLKSPRRPGLNIDGPRFKGAA